MSILPYGCECIHCHKIYYPYLGIPHLCDERLLNLIRIGLAKKEDER